MVEGHRTHKPLVMGLLKKPSALRTEKNQYSASLILRRIRTPLSSANPTLAIRLFWLSQACFWEFGCSFIRCSLPRCLSPWQLLTYGFEKLLINFPVSIPRSLKSAGKDVDIEWEFLENEIISFQGAIFGFCIDHYASYGLEGSQIEFTRSLNTYDDFIAGFKKV